MLLLAAKLGILASGGYVQGTNADIAVWQKVHNSIGMLTRRGEILGPAAFISADGYAVANTLIVQKGATEIVTEAGLHYKITVEANDGTSQLTLLKTTTRPAGITFVQAADRSDGEKGTVVAVLPKQYIKAELTGTEKIGIDQKSKRTFPIQEVRVEQNAFQMGGALLFSKNGRLIGGLFAALAQEQTISSKAQTLRNSADFNNQGSQQGGGNAFQNLNNTRANVGPQAMIVGYTPTWEVTSKALSGFLTPAKKAQYGLLGVFIVDNQYGGVEIKSITKDSSAEAAGLEVGDVIREINGTRIRNQVDFSRATYRMIPGTTIPIQVRRKVELITLMVTIGIQHALVVGHPIFSTERFDSPEIR